MADFINKLKVQFSTASMLMRFIYINIAVFFILRIIGLGCLFCAANSSAIINYILVPSSFSELLMRPWSLFTYMFAQYDILHILFNMLWLYFFGVIFLTFLSPKQFAGLYIIGGLAGALVYVAAYSFFPCFANVHSVLIGSSAAVTAIVIAIAIIAPNYQMNLLFLGGVALKWIAVVAIAIDIISIDSVDSGGAISHIGGALAGVAFAMLYRKGTDITRPINAILDFFANLFNRRPAIKVKKGSKKKSQYHYAPSEQASSSSNMSKEDENNLDEILDKIKKSGYTSLSDDEKKKLFEISRR